MDYYGVATPGMIGAALGSVANGVYKGHNMKLLFIRLLENVALVGLPIAWVVGKMSPDTSGVMYIAMVGVGVFLAWNNPLTKPLVTRIDDLGTSILGLLVS